MSHPAHHKALSAAGIASNVGSGRKGQNAVLRSARQRRKAFRKAEDKLIYAAYLRWGTTDAMPLEDQGILREKSPDCTHITSESRLQKFLNFIRQVFD